MNWTLSKLEYFFRIYFNQEVPIHLKIKNTGPAYQDIYVTY